LAALTPEDRARELVAHRVEEYRDAIRVRVAVARRQPAIDAAGSASNIRAPM
jgi:hypothetical protein